MKHHGLGLPALTPSEQFHYDVVLDDTIQKQMDHYLDCGQRPGDAMMEYNEALFDAAQKRADITGSSRRRLLSNEHRVCLAMAYVRPEVNARFAGQHRIEVNGHGRLSGTVAVYQDLLLFGEEEYPAAWCRVTGRKPGVWGTVVALQDNVEIGVLTEVLPKLPRSLERARSEYYEGALRYPDGRQFEGRFRLVRRRVLGELSAFSGEELDQALSERERSIESLQANSRLVTAVATVVRARRGDAAPGRFPCLVTIAEANGRNHREWVQQLALAMYA